MSQDWPHSKSQMECDIYLSKWKLGSAFPHSDSDSSDSPPLPLPLPLVNIYLPHFEIAIFVVAGCKARNFLGFASTAACCCVQNFFWSWDRLCDAALVHGRERWLFSIGVAVTCTLNPLKGCQIGRASIFMWMRTASWILTGGGRSLQGSRIV